MDLRVLGWNAHWRDLFNSHFSDSLTPGRIVAAHRGAYYVETDAGGCRATISGRLRHEAMSSADLPAVGDFVAARAPERMPFDGPAVIHAVLPRRTAFVRRAAGSRSEDQVIAANVDIVFVVVGLDHDFNVRRVERYLAAVWDGGALPVVVLNKSDVCDAVVARVAEIQRVAVGTPVHELSALRAEGLDALQSYLAEGTTVSVVGSSGAGKSTLLNRLLGREVQATAEVRRHDSRGRHTTTHRELFVLPTGGIVIDTPGMRGLLVSPSEQEPDHASGVDRVFADIDALAQLCRFNDCTHTREPGCAVRDGVDSGVLDADRLTAYGKLIGELRYDAARSDANTMSERKRAGRISAKAMRRMSRERRR